MNTKQITPPDFTRVLFPVKGNETNLEKAKMFGIKQFGEYLLYEGTQQQEAKKILYGGVTADGFC